MCDLSDEDLMVLVAGEASEEAFKELFERYWRRIVSHVARLLGPSSAEDVAQEAFVRVARYRHTYDRKRPFAPWLFQIVRNLVASARQRRARKELSIADLPEERLPLHISDVGGHVPSHASPDDETRLAAARAFRELDDAAREVITLRLHEGLKFREIARLLGVTEDGARKRFLAGLEKLRKQLARSRPCPPSIVSS